MMFQSARSKGKQPHTARGPSGKRCYAIGDIHGRLDLFKDLLEKIASHNAARPPGETAIVLLGDLIDRGPNSNEVVELAYSYRAHNMRLIPILGNHEELMLKAIAGDIDAFQTWMAHGGVATVRSYGIDTRRLTGLKVEDFRRRVADAIPQSHVEFLRSAVDSVRFGDYLLVHAGILPGRPIEEQLAKDLRWIRQAFLSSSADHGCVVVHGHSQGAVIEVKANRIGIDTGAYHSGVLTAVWFEGVERGFIQTAGRTMDIAVDTSFG